MTVNQRLADAAVGHAVDLQHYGNDVVRRIMALLNRADSEIAAALAEALERLPASAFSVERLETLLRSVRELNVRAYSQVGAELTKELKALAEYEAGYQLELFRAAVPPQVIASAGLVSVNAEQAYAAAMARPFQGRLLKEWAQSIEEGRMTRIRDAVRMGYVQQETVQQIVRRIVGSRDRNQRDGIIEIDRRNAEAVVRTAISHTAGFTRDRFYEANADLVKAEVWSATLDTRTSDLCRIRDGKKYTAGTHKPIGHSVPWLAGPGRLHWQCRSSSVPVLKSWRDLGVDADEAAPSTRASMDGQVPEDTTYGQWLKRQSAARQDQVLGPERGKLFRAGGLTLEQFYNDKGRLLTLDELRKRDAVAFRDAGVR